MGQYIELVIILPYSVIAVEKTRYKENKIQQKATEQQGQNELGIEFFNFSREKL